MLNNAKDIHLILLPDKDIDVYELFSGCGELGNQCSCLDEPKKKHV